MRGEVGDDGAPLRFGCREQMDKAERRRSRAGGQARSASGPMRPRASTVTTARAAEPPGGRRLGKHRHDVAEVRQRLAAHRVNR